MLRLWDEATDNPHSAANVSSTIIIASSSTTSSKLLKRDILRASATVLSLFPLRVSSEGGGEEKGTGARERLSFKVWGAKMI